MSAFGKGVTASLKAKDPERTIALPCPPEQEQRTWLRAAKPDVGCVLPFTVDSELLSGHATVFCYKSGLATMQGKPPAEDQCGSIPWGSLKCGVLKYSHA